MATRGVSDAVLVEPRLRFVESVVGQGSTFVIELPVPGRAAVSTGAAR